MWVMPSVPASCLIELMAKQNPCPCRVFWDGEMGLAACCSWFVAWQCLVGFPRIERNLGSFACDTLSENPKRGWFSLDELSSRFVKNRRKDFLWSNSKKTGLSWQTDLPHLSNRITHVLRGWEWGHYWSWDQVGKELLDIFMSFNVDIIHLCTWRNYAEVTSKLTSVLSARNTEINCCG